VTDDETAARNDVRQPPEDLLDLVEVPEDVGVVELDGPDQRRVRLVVHELRALVEECSVVLVSLDDERGTGADPVRAVEVLGEPADQEPGIAAGVVEDPGQHRGGRRLPVRAGDDDRVPAGEEALLEESGHRRVPQPPVEDLFRLGVPPPHGVADDDEIGSRVEVPRIVSLEDPDAHLREDRGGRRIERPVGAGHLRSRLA